MRKITPEDLVQYLYNESSPQKAKAIKAALENDWPLNETFENIVSAKKQLKELDISPREEALKRILDNADKTISHSHSH